MADSILRINRLERELLEKRGLKLKVPLWDAPAAS